MFNFLKRLGSNQSIQIGGDNSTQIDVQNIVSNGSNITISNGKITVDGVVVSSYGSQGVKVIINGDVKKIDCAGSVEVHGNSGSIDCGGSCTVGGNVDGNIDAGGSIHCGNVSGDVDAGGSVNQNIFTKPKMAKDGHI
jgi:hypothetical protein